MSVTFWGWNCPYCGDDTEPFDDELDTYGPVNCHGCGKPIKGIFKRCKNMEEKIEGMINKYEEKVEELKTKEANKNA